MRHFLFCILILLSVHSSAQFTGAIWAGARVSGEAAPPVPYEPETLQYIDTLVANSIDTAGVWAVNWLIWTLKGNNVSYSGWPYWDSLLALYPIHGGSAISHAIDIKDVSGSKILWFGSPSHTPNGVVGNGAAYGRSVHSGGSSTSFNEGLGVGVWAGETDASGTSSGDSIASFGYSISTSNPNGFTGLQSRGKYAVPGSGIVTIANNDRLYPFGTSPLNFCSYLQKDTRRAGDSTRIWYNAFDEYKAYLNSNSITAQSDRYYGLLCRNTAVVPSVTPMDISANCFTYFFINRGNLNLSQGHEIVSIFEQYNQKLRGL